MRCERVASTRASARRSSRGVSRAARPERRRSRPGVRAAVRRCCSARMPCGVVGAPRRTEKRVALRRGPVGVRPAVLGVRALVVFAAERLAELAGAGVRACGVLGL